MKSENTYSVYQHVFPDGKRYIGITGRPVEQRWGTKGKYYSLKTQPVVAQAIKKYGWDNIQHQVIATHLSRRDAENMEIGLIEFYKATDPEYGYNVQTGGSCLTRGRPVSDETRKRISAALVGKHANFTGRKHTDGTLRKMQLVPHSPVARLGRYRVVLEIYPTIKEAARHLLEREYQEYKDRGVKHYTTQTCRYRPIEEMCDDISQIRTWAKRIQNGKTDFVRITKKQYLGSEVGKRLKEVI